MDTKLTSRINKLLLPSQESSFFSEALEVTPQDLSQKPLGKLLIVAEIASPNEENQEVGETLIDSIKTEYYKDSSRDILESFEAALQKANETLADLTEASKTSWLGKLHMIIGVLNNDNLHLAQAGNAEAYLARGEQIVKISEGLAETTEKKDQPLKTFENIASGNIEESDRVILSTPELFYHISLEELRREATDKTPEEASSELSQKLKGEEGIGNLAALIIEVTTEDKLSEEPLSQAAGIPKKEPVAEEVKEVKADAKSFAQKAKDAFKTTKAKLTKDKIEKPEAAKKETPKVSEKIQAPVTPKPTSVEEPKAPNKFLNALKKFSRKIKTAVSKINQSSLNKNRMLLGAILVLVIVLFISGGILIWQKNSGSSKDAYYNKLIESQDKQKAAEDALIYDNEIRARQLLVEATSLIDEILGSKYYNDEANNLKNEVQVTLDKINHITRITNPKAVADFAGLPSTETLGTLLALDEYLYTFNPQNAGIFDTPLEKPKAEAATEASISVGKLKCGAVMKDQGILVFYSEVGGIYEFDPETGKLEQKELEAGDSLAKAEAIGTYFSNIYLLDPAQNKIEKHSRTLSGYGRGENYITDETVSLDGAVSMAIDGYIYVLMNDGEITKFLEGSPAKFEISNLPDPMQDPTLIFTDSDTDYVYILDKGNGRIVVLDDKGGFTAQYVGEELKEATGIYADEANKKGYFISGQKIYQFNLKHLS
ncbi:hypothetical protein ACFL24_02410 [Patescibacteria group bacterium]